jgi:hypothetical protein
MTATKWFDEYGNFIGEFSAECVADCSASGAVDDAVAYWLKKLNFEVPRSRAIAWLLDFGAWPEETDEYNKGLNDMTDDELALKVLWLACCDIKEQGEWFGIN